MVRKTNKVTVLGADGKKLGDFSLPDVLLGRVNMTLISQALRVYNSNSRRGLAKVKGRGEVSGSNKKIWRQKGTGRARHGDRYAPIFVGGGIAHGPTGGQNYSLKLTKKQKKAALFSLLSWYFLNKKVTVVKDVSKIEPKTKKGLNFLQNILGKEYFKDKKNGPVLLIVLEKTPFLERGFGNLPNITIDNFKNINALKIAKYSHLIFTKKALLGLANK